MCETLEAIQGDSRSGGCSLPSPPGHLFLLVSFPSPFPLLLSLFRLLSDHFPFCMGSASLLQLGASSFCLTACRSIFVWSGPLRLHFVGWYRVFFLTAKWGLGGRLWFSRPVTTSVVELDDGGGLVVRG